MGGCELEAELAAGPAKRHLGSLPLAHVSRRVGVRAHRTAARTSSDRSSDTCWATSEPIERPTRTTGGSHTASISRAQSTACASIGQGGGAGQLVSPTPRVIGRIAEIRKGRNLEVVPTGPPLIASREPHEIKPRARLLVEENDVAEVEFRHPQTDTSSAPVWLMNPAGLQVGTESAHPTG